MTIDTDHDPALTSYGSDGGTRERERQLDDVAHSVARVEDAYRPDSSAWWAPKFAAMLRHGEFVPHAPTVRSVDDSNPTTAHQLSIRLTDEFMRDATENPAPIGRNDDRSAHPGSARALLQHIAAQTLSSAESTLLFVDTIDRSEPVPDSPNPGVFGNYPVGWIDLSHFTHGRSFDRNRLADVVRNAVRYLDDAIEISHYPTPELAAAARGTRRIGLGITGLEQVLSARGFRYDSPAAVSYAARLMGAVTEWAHSESRDLALERGEFPLFAKSRWAERRCAPMRNAQLTANAPLPSSLAATTRLHPLPRQTPAAQLRMCAALQWNTDGAAAATITIPADACDADIMEIIHDAWHAALRFITLRSDVPRADRTPDDMNS